jgi:hypothetical protein
MENIDVCLRHAGVIFLPWIGPAYDAGFRGKKLLVLAEAHYDWPGREEECPNMADVTRYVLVKARRKGTWGFWGLIESACTGVARAARASASPFWDRVAFYNFIPEFPAGTLARARPSRQQFKAGYRPFRSVLESLRPNRVIVCGHRLWNGMEPTREEDRRSDDVQAYRLEDESAVWCLATYHPSSGRYHPQELTPKIWPFLDEEP